MINPNKLQMIVDGECSHEVRLDFLRELDAEPQGWRTLALAMLEEQQWLNQISAASHSPLSPIASDRISAEAPLNNAEKPRLKSAQPFVSSQVWFSALAAGLLMAIGFYGGSFLADRSSALSRSKPPSVVVANEPPREIDYRGMKMVVTGPNSETSEIPIYDMEEVDPTVMWAKENYEIARMNEKLRKQGYELDVRPEYYTGTLNDGRKLIVPVKNVGLKPFGL
ncbi:MAG: hypothetical protein NTU79_18450 [Planctomycetota bacterium]|nr:hypothetical protein [Planctomycetota bacterium]